MLPTAHRRRAGLLCVLLRRHVGQRAGAAQRGEAAADHHHAARAHGASPGPGAWSGSACFEHSCASHPFSQGVCLVQFEGVCVRCNSGREPADTRMQEGVCRCMPGREAFWGWSPATQRWWSQYLLASYTGARLRAHLQFKPQTLTPPRPECGSSRRVQTAA